MNLEWLYSNLTWIIVVLIFSTIILFLFPVILGADLLKKSKKKKNNGYFIYRFSNGSNFFGYNR